MSSKSSASAHHPVPLRAFGWAALGVLAFSGTFPATTLALRGFDPYVVGAGRSVIGASLALATLLATRAPLPRREDRAGLLAVAAGCGIGFGLLSALALQHTTTTHAAIITGLLPMATAIVAVLRGGERPGRLFWLASGVGTAAVIAYTLSRGAGRLHGADVLLLLALAVAAVGYAEGGRLSRSMPGWQVIAWGLVLALPISLPVALIALGEHPPHPSAQSLAGFAYVSVISVFIGFFAWFRGMAGAGVARASQVQLGQPLLTICWAALLLGEAVDAKAAATAVVVIACVALTQRSRRAAATEPAQANWGQRRASAMLALVGLGRR